MQGMPKLIIDRIENEAPDGATILAAPTHLNSTLRTYCANLVP